MRVCKSSSTFQLVFSRIVLITLYLSGWIWAEGATYVQPNTEHYLSAMFNSIWASLTISCLFTAIDQVLLPIMSHILIHKNYFRFRNWISPKNLANKLYHPKRLYAFSKQYLNQVTDNFSNAILCRSLHGCVWEYATLFQCTPFIKLCIT